MSKKKVDNSEVAAAAVMPEDLELDRMLASLTADVPDIADPEPIGSVVVKERVKLELLREAVEDYKPASTRQEIMDQVYLAKTEGCDSIEATLLAIRSICRDSSLESVGYFMYHDIKVFIEGRASEAMARDRRTVEQVNFGHSSMAEKNKLIRDKIKALEAELE